jgi:hypothetical protein
MRYKTPLIWLTAGLLTALAIMISGCSTKKPWATNPNTPLTLSLVSGPSNSLSVPLGSVITFTWTYAGGEGLVQYQYKLDDGAWSPMTEETIATISGVGMGPHTFSIRAQDAAQATSQVNAAFQVVEASIPTVMITASPESGASIATGSTISFTWVGNDANSGPDYMLYRYIFAGVASNWAPALTVSFENVATDPMATFKVVAQDLAGNMSDTASVSFVIKPATILYVDDYQWLDSFGNVDRAKEREQKNFYRQALDGYAFAEWDNDAMGGVPTMQDLVGFTTIIWAADGDVCSADPTYRLYFDIGAEGGGVLKEFIDGGGHLLITGNEVLNYLYNTIPPAPTDFEAAYLGVSDTLIIADIDTSVTPPETTYVETWVESSDFTWAIKTEGSTLDLPDSMKIDVAKNGDQLACDASLVYLKSDDVPLFTVGLDVFGDPPDDYGLVNGWIYKPGGNAISASLMFDTFSMPLPGIRQTFHTILNEFGEGPGL